MLLSVLHRIVQGALFDSRSCQFRASEICAAGAEHCSLHAGATHISTADFPMPNRHSMTEPAYFDEVDPKMNRRIS